MTDKTQPTWQDIWSAILKYGALKEDAIRILYADNDIDRFFAASKIAAAKQEEIGDMLLSYIATHVPVE